MHPTSSMRYHRQPLPKSSVLFLLRQRSLTFIGFALLPELTSCLDRRFTTMLLEIIIRHNFTANEFVLKVAVNDTCGLGCLCALSYRPGTNLIGSTGEVTDELVWKISPHAQVNWSTQLTWRLVYPACVILGRALVVPIFCSSSFFSSGDMSARRSSKATEKGMRGSPGLFSSIQALIFGSLHSVVNLLS